MSRIQLINDIYSGQNLKLLGRDLTDWPEIAALEQTIQDKEWHAEGNVLIHTDMVLAETPRIISDMNLTDEEAATLRLACLFHDINKPTTTEYNEEIGHVIAPGHERQGGIKTRYLLHEFKDVVSNEMRLSVSNLVATHHLVKRSVKRYDEDGGKAYLRALASRVNTKLLYALELADMRGRECVDQQGQIEIVELFRMICEEQNLFGRYTNSPFFLMDFLHLTTDDWVLRYSFKEMNRRRLTGELDNDFAAKAFCIDRIKKIERGEIPYPACVDIAVGISGSGKSYLKTTEMKNRIVICPDDERKALHGNDANQSDPGFIIQLCTEKLKEALRNADKKAKVYYDATNVVSDLRSKITTLCHDYGALVFLHVFDVSIETAKANNRKRSRNVPDSVIEKQASKFELPLPEEAHHIFYHF